jgi:hypothetical protein
VKRFLLYLARWQASTPVLWLVVANLGAGLEATIIANLIGGSIFFWIDRFIFRNRMHVEWEVRVAGTCADCGAGGRVRRLILAPGADSGTLYDRRYDEEPEFRCSACSARKIGTLMASKRLARGLSLS